MGKFGGACGHFNNDSVDRHGNPGSNVLGICADRMMARTMDVLYVIAVLVDRHGYPGICTRLDGSF